MSDNLRNNRLTGGFSNTQRNRKSSARSYSEKWNQEYNYNGHNSIVEPTARPRPAKNGNRRPSSWAPALPLSTPNGINQNNRIGENTRQNQDHTMVNISQSQPHGGAINNRIRPDENTRQNHIIKDFLMRNGIRLEEDDFSKTLGEGSFSRVVRAHRRSRPRNNNQYQNQKTSPVAVKMVDRKALATNMREKFMPRELDIIKDAIHPNIIKLHTILRLQNISIDRIFIITDLAEGGDLLDYIMAKGKLREARSRRLFRDITKAVCYLHEMKISHRDLKGENVLLKMNQRGKPEKAYLTDFGFARRMDGIRQKSTTFCGSTAYVSPEILENVPYEPFVSDCWSLGVILYIMLCAFMPYETQNVRKMTMQQKQPVDFYHMAGKLSPSVEALIRGLMNPNINKRLSAHQIAQSDWIREGFKKKQRAAKFNQTL